VDEEMRQHIAKAEEEKKRKAAIEGKGDVKKTDT
jgi:hypothetical protein